MQDQEKAKSRSRFQMQDPDIDWSTIGARSIEPVRQVSIQILEKSNHSHDIWSIEVVQKIIIQIPEKFDHSHEQCSIDQRMCTMCHIETRGVRLYHDRLNTCDPETLQFD